MPQVFSYLIYLIFSPTLQCAPPQIFVIFVPFLLFFFFFFWCKLTSRHSTPFIIKRKHRTRRQIIKVNPCCVIKKIKQYPEHNRIFFLSFVPDVYIKAAVKQIKLAQLPAMTSDIRLLNGLNSAASFQQSFWCYSHLSPRVIQPSFDAQLLCKLHSDCSKTSTHTNRWILDGSLAGACQLSQFFWCCFCGGILYCVFLTGALCFSFEWNIFFWCKCCNWVGRLYTSRETHAIIDFNCKFMTGYFGWTQNILYDGTHQTVYNGPIIQINPQIYCIQLFIQIGGGQTGPNFYLANNTQILYLKQINAIKYILVCHHPPCLPYIQTFTNSKKMLQKSATCLNLKIYICKIVFQHGNHPFWMCDLLGVGCRTNLWYTNGGCGSNFLKCGLFLH
ncbi:putative signal peptide protein [Puccinia sorghi]|uniref:Putative signal peptide protein n=1 Tax=Puccinia sorghi TaxID=27349 RepID=A0A0L6VBF3_9BASI|nr:putative signal peptide protein [Puccinia sorghi]